MRSSDLSTCKDIPHLQTSPLPQFSGLKNKQVMLQLHEVLFILVFGLQAELQPQVADKAISMVLSLVEPKPAGTF